MFTQIPQKYECAGDVVDFKTWLGISIRDYDNEYYGFRWSNLFKLIWHYLSGSKDTSGLDLTLRGILKRNSRNMRSDMTDMLRMEHRGDDGEVLFMTFIWRDLLGIHGPLVREVILKFFSTFCFRETVLNLDTLDTLQFQLGGLRRQLSMRRFISILGLHTDEEMHTEGFRAYWEAGLRRIATKEDMVDYWTRISFEGDFLGPPPLYILIREPLRRLCHRLIDFTIYDNGQSLKKVTTTDLFFLCNMDEGTVVNVPYLLAQYLFRHAWGRNTGAQMSDGHFIAHLGGGAQIDDHEGPVIILDRIQRVEEEVQQMSESLSEQHVMIEGLMSKHARYSSWMVDWMTELMEIRGMRYERMTNLWGLNPPPHRLKPGLWNHAGKMFEVIHELDNEMMGEWLTRGYVSMHEMDLS
ncbi:hypothetical protein Tco_0533684 [Tanacetum coccineum]